MRIKIPYNLIDNFENVDFVSLILENGEHSLYRLDILRSIYKNFYLKKQKYMIVPDDSYEKCDTVVFYPYYRDIGWGNKLISRNGFERFVRFDGSSHLIKNVQKEGNVEAAKQWIFNGANISPNENVAGSKNLIYFTMFGDPSYIKLLEVLISTLKKQDYKNFDILFITDKPTAPKIKKIKALKNFNVDYLILPKIKDPVEASMQKLKIYDYPKVDEYSNILFLDVDIVVIGSLSKIFEEKTRPNVFYSGVHRVVHRMHKTKFHSLIEYSEQELGRFEKQNIFPFNAGQFFFKNTSSMKEHFKNINDFVSKWDGEYFFEQSFINCYFNVLAMSNIFKFKEQFQFVSINEGEANNAFGPDAVFVHFMGSTADAKDKLFFIKKHYSHLL